MAHRPAAPVQLLLQRRAERAGLDPGQPGLLVDLQHLVQPAQIQRDDLAVLTGQRLQGADDVGPAAEGDQHRIGLDHRVDDPAYLLLVGGVDDHIGHPLELAAAHPDQVPDGLAEGVHHPVHVLGDHIFLTECVDELAAQRVAEPGGRHLDLVEGRRPAGGGIQIQADLLQHERREVRLVLVVESDAVDTPTPPLHVLDAVHWSFSFSSGESRLLVIFSASAASS